MKKTFWQRANKQQVTILAMMMIPDSVAIVLSAITAYNFRFPDARTGTAPSIAEFDYKFILFSVALIWSFILLLTGTYKFNHANLVGLNLRLVAKRTITFFFFLGFLSFILKASFSRSVFLVMLSSGLIYIFVIRLSIYFFVIRRLISKKKINSQMMIIGKSKTDIELHSEWLIKNRNLGFTIVSRLVCPSIDSEWVKDFDRILVYHDIAEILFLPGMETDPNFSKLIHYCEDLDIHVNWIPLDSGNLGYWLIPSPQEGIPFLTFEKSQISLPWRILKRSFDLVFSLALMILLSPVFLAISLAVLISSGWPIFYSQTRIGYQGRKFKFYKFRSMVKDADKMVNQIENIHEDDHVLFKNRQDPRVTPIGRILRKYSLDELPQFLNVLNNTMSVVGPRPALPKEVYAYNSIYERRLNVKPGITGPWQISGRSDLDLGTSISLDLNYMTNWSFSRDLWIIFATVGAIFKGKGAY